MESYRITFRPSGRIITTEPTETILEAALRHGLSLPYGCRNGSCGTCKGKIIQGIVDYGAYSEEVLTEQEKEQHLALFCCARPLSDLEIECQEIEAVKDIRVRTMPCRVHKLEHVASDVMIIYLKLPANERLQFLPGQYIDILMKDGQRRSFSLANAPGNDEFLQLHTRNYAGGVFSEYVFSHMKEKDILRFEGPLGSFFLHDTPKNDTPIIFLAGGTGFAPVKSMLEYLFYTENTRFKHNKIKLYWGARTRDGLYLNDLAKKWEEENKNFSYIPVLSEPLLTDNWQGKNGLVHQAVMEDMDTLSDCQVYACGAPAMVKAAFDNFTSQRNLQEENFFSDAFIPSKPAVT
ncbi:CDP-6-deoxy-delta-3,4-glucoseen reductase [Nitrosomonas eutropha]|uniref:CDP-4-dehydro-6-deoxyglucose reductase n=2 Tax=Nitrosomonas eutropha TaxID=916 RepID=A0ABX5M6X0_9PROT|nr:CDP-6-deoxy-delta-3,4-glucoseen reductase [Nitrosomonas eutropha]ABI59297.1 oxidoreductase FAD/NAD(P)-binding domain protein [Nitrosomonas eutropha C91]PXV81084.1 CDP-4-dehydro-6-deoxyglucose reductase [Nitrosomonas eutropha]SDW85135.1 CDP-4-dehydro-6-deoxyglucose reductase [Nitrosomonas eutropha]